MNLLSSGLRTTSCLDLRGRLPREPAGFTFVDYLVFEVHCLLPGDLMRWLMGMVHMDMDETIDGIHKIKIKNKAIKINYMVDKKMKNKIK